ncbi:hypothetical protein HDZ31DRAFT_71237 [Schizophyllum fasciatum]
MPKTPTKGGELLPELPLTPPRPRYQPPSPNGKSPHYKKEEQSDIERREERKTRQKKTPLPHFMILPLGTRIIAEDSVVEELKTFDVTSLLPIGATEQQREKCSQGTMSITTCRELIEREYQQRQAASVIVEPKPAKCYAETSVQTDDEKADAGHFFEVSDGKIVIRVPDLLQHSTAAAAIPATVVKWLVDSGNEAVMGAIHRGRSLASRNGEAPRVE